MLFRAFYALPDSIKGADGQPVNALLGTANLILREIDEHDPRAVVLCFGPDAADYRVELFEGYHADRPELPDTLAPQFAGSRDFSRRSAGPWPRATRSRRTTCSAPTRAARRTPAARRS
jgi:5'-3' exonuclease